MQAISLITSGLMLGIKVAKITALPAVWKKLSKRRAVAQPLREAADLGTQLRHEPARPDFTREEYITGVEKLHEALASWAVKPVPAGLKKTGTKIQAELEKTSQVLAVLIGEVNALNAPPSSPQVNPSQHHPTLAAHWHAHSGRPRTVPVTSIVLPITFQRCIAQGIKNGATLYECTGVLVWQEASSDVPARAPAELRGVA
jgi:hypothetical protein